MKEVVGARNDADGKFERFSPLEHVGERHSCIIRAVNYKSVERNGLNRVLAVAFDKTHRRTDQHQPPRRSIGFGEPFCQPRDDEGAEGKAGEKHGQIASEAANGVVMDGEQVVGFRAALAVPALAGSDAAEVRPKGMVAEIAEGARQRRDDLVVGGAPEQRVRMSNQRDSRCDLARFDEDLDLPARPVDENALVAGHQILSRPTPVYGATSE